jgi:hypothetical protein
LDLAVTVEETEAVDVAVAVADAVARPKCV